MVFPVAGSWVYPWKVVAGIHRGATTISWPQWVQAAGAERVLHLLYPPPASYNHHPPIILLVLSRIRNPEYGCGVGADICGEAPDPGS